MVDKIGLFEGNEAVSRANFNKRVEQANKALEDTDIGFGKLEEKYKNITDQMDLIEQNKINIEQFDIIKNEISTLLTNMETSISQMGNDKANKSKRIDITLDNSDWTGDQAPYSQTIAAADVTADCNLISGLVITADDEQEDAYHNSNIKLYTASAGSLTYRCAEKPAINLPISVLIVG